MSMQVNYDTPLTQQERSYLLERGRYGDVERADSMHGVDAPALPSGDGTGLQQQGMMTGEVAAGELERLKARIAELEAKEAADVDDEVLPYEQWGVDDLKAEIDDRNKERPADQKLAKTGTKADLADRLYKDDEASS